MTAVGQTLLGAVAGGTAAAFVLLVVWLVSRRRHRQLDPGPRRIDRDMSDVLDQAAASWAEAHGRPEVSGLLADKLKLAYLLSEPRRKRWK